MAAFNILNGSFALLTAATSSSPSSDMHTADNPDGFDPNAPRFRGLVLGVLLCRQMGRLYILACLAILLLFTFRHWGKVAFWRINRTQQASKESRPPRDLGILDSPGRKEARQYHGFRPYGELARESLMASDAASTNSSSSSNSTRVASVDVDAVKHTENTPLLGQSEPEAEAAPSKNIFLRIYDYTYSFFLYQPGRIPIVEKDLPPNGISICVLLLLALNVFFTTYRITFSIELLFIFSCRASTMFVANLPLLYILAAKNQPLKFLTSYSYESLNVFHRRLGEIMCLLALTHMVSMIVCWFTTLQDFGFTVQRFWFNPVVIYGFCAIICFETIYLTSLRSFRQTRYELFLAMHIGLQIGALFFLFLHHEQTRIYAGSAIAIFAIDRVVYRLLLRTTTTVANLEVRADGKTVSVEVPNMVQCRSFLARAIGIATTKAGWAPTQHIFITVPALSSRHIVQAHPFTIASRAPQIQTSDVENAFPKPDNSLRLIIRGQDGFSRDLVEYAQHSSTARVRLDGPYGSTEAVDFLSRKDIRIIIAGGSGIAVTVPLFWGVVDHPHSSPESESVFIWQVRRAEHLTWLENHELADISAQHNTRMYIPPPTEDAGRADLPGSLRQEVQRSVGQSVGVVCSGPDSMAREIRNTVAELRGLGYDVDVMIEKFGW